MSASKCGAPIKPRVPETLTFTPPGCKDDAANNNNKAPVDESKQELERELKKCSSRPMPKTDCSSCTKKEKKSSSSCSNERLPPPPVAVKCEEAPKKCGGGGGNDNSPYVPLTTIPKMECGFDESCGKKKDDCDCKAPPPPKVECQIEEPKKRDCNCGKPIAPTPRPECGSCNGKGSRCGPNTACEVIPLKMKKKK